MTTEHKNLYEDLIEDMILEGIKGMTPELKKIIKDAPVEKQRELILNFMEENNPEHRLLCGEIRKVVANNKTSEYKHISSLVQMLRQYVKVSDVEVKTMGEVMTPIELVEEMLDTLPYEVWTNPNLKWLDPCNGVGTFVSVIIKRLMKGLETFEPDAELRYKHIMENMIYTCELQPKNVFLYMYAFDPEDRYALNVFNGSYLSEEFDRHMKFWSVEKFDVIVMNPPYNSASSTGRGGIGHTLWDKFVVKTISQIVDGGYLVAVHPDGWRTIGKGYEEAKKLLREKQLTYLEVHNITDGVKTFGVQTSYDFYCLHNVPSTMFTKIKCLDGTIERADISKMNFIPNGMYKTYENLIAKNDEETVNVLYSRSDYGHDKPHINNEKTDIFKYPCIHLTYKDGSIRFSYSSTKENGHFGIPKVIWSNGGASMPIIDENGDYGVIDFSYAIIDEPKNLPFIQKALAHPDFIKLMSFADGKTGCRQRYNYKIIALFRKDFWKEFLY